MQRSRVFFALLLRLRRHFPKSFKAYRRTVFSKDAFNKPCALGSPETTLLSPWIRIMSYLFNGESACRSCWKHCRQSRHPAPRPLESNQFSVYSGTSPSSLRLIEEESSQKMYDISNKHKPCAIGCPKPLS